MAKEFERKRRVANAVRELVAPIVDRHSRDKGFGLVSVTDVDVAPDLRQCSVYLSVYGDSEKQSEVLDYFAHLAKQIRGEVASQLTMKRNPALTFKLDDGLERSDRLARLLDEDSHTNG